MSFILPVTYGEVGFDAAALTARSYVFVVFVFLHGELDVARLSLVDIAYMRLYLQLFRCFFLNVLKWESSHHSTDNIYTSFLSLHAQR